MTIEWLAGNRIRGTNTERTTTTGFNTGLSGAGGWVELARTTLGSAGDTITVSSLPDKRYYMLLRNNFHSGAVRTGIRFGNSTIDTGTNYSARRSNNGAADATNVSLNRIVGDEDGTVIDFNVEYIANLSGKEKLYQRHQVQQKTAGAGTAPSRLEMVGKWANTSNPIDTIQSINTETGSFDTGSEIVVLGWDPADTHTTNFWEELASVELGSAGDNLSSGTIAAKKYLWIQYYAKKTGTANTRWRFNNDTGSNYAARQSGNGDTGSALTSQTSIYTHADTSGNAFGNIFIINNSANEKLGIFHEVSDNVNRREVVAKWANTSAQITEVDLLNTDSGGFSAGTIMKVWGSN